MARPVAPAPLGLGAASVACARPLNALITEIRPARACEHKKLKKVGAEEPSLAPQDMDPVAVA